MNNKHLNISHPVRAISGTKQPEETSVDGFTTVVVTTSILLYFYNPNSNDE
ncbi:MAG: hypothetical protein RBT50_12475 [Bacteroidales bacterium]|jgi:hypothetical protein|nr:hypothetical protein [Bacteroidales bacterium]